ncbi:MAG: hypothetical protein ACNA8G_09415 [Gammaproteobacteria bacterium]
MLLSIVDAGGRPFTTLSMAVQHADALADVQPSFSDLDAWKRRQTYE